MDDPKPLRVLQLLLAARSGRADALVERLETLASSLVEATGDVDARAVALARLEPDPFAQMTPGLRSFDATLEIRLPTGNDFAPLIAAAGALRGELGADIHCDLSGALVGHLHQLVKGEAVPVRYQYVMRRKADWTHESYEKHYREHHYQYGLTTPGHHGYDQLRVNLDASRAAAEAAGFGTWQADSNSQLHLASIEEFFEAAVGSTAGNEASEDEENFVDRQNSVMFCSKRIGL